MGAAACYVERGNLLIGFLLFYLFFSEKLLTNFYCSTIINISNRFDIGSIF